MMLTDVRFLPSDWTYPHLEAVSIKIADFLYTYKSKLSDFCDLMRNSGSWNLKNYKDKLAQWISSKKGRRTKTVAADTLRLFELAYEFFDVCKNDRDLKKMRGLVPEKLIEKIFNLRYIGKKCVMGFGKLVCVNGTEVKYVCEDPYDHSPEDSDCNRQSVDAGAWDGGFGEFVEVKFNPEAFHTKDIKYLRLLVDNLNKESIPHQVFLIAFDNKELIEKKLNRLGLWVQSEFQLIGKEEVFDLQNVG